jgi:hypothetical protein
MTDLRPEVVREFTELLLREHVLREQLDEQSAHMLATQEEWSTAAERLAGREPALRHLKELERVLAIEQAIRQRVADYCFTSAYGIVDDPGPLPWE